MVAWKFEVAPDGPARLVSQGTRAPVELCFEPATGPAQRMLVNLEYAQGIGDSRGVYLKLGYAW